MLAFKPCTCGSKAYSQFFFFCLFFFKECTAWHNMYSRQRFCGWTIFFLVCLFFLLLSAEEGMGRMQALRTETVMESERVDGRNHGVITPACSQVQINTHTENTCQTCWELSPFHLNHSTHLFKDVDTKDCTFFFSLSPFFRFRFRLRQTWQHIHVCCGIEHALTCLFGRWINLWKPWFWFAKGFPLIPDNGLCSSSETLWLQSISQHLQWVTIASVTASFSPYSSELTNDSYHISNHLTSYSLFILLFQAVADTTHGLTFVCVILILIRGQWCGQLASFLVKHVVKLYKQLYRYRLASLMLAFWLIAEPEGSSH